MVPVPVNAAAINERRANAATCSSCHALIKRAANATERGITAFSSAVDRLCGRLPCQAPRHVTVCEVNIDPIRQSVQMPKMEDPFP
jgi:hypothetical protein